MEWMLMPYRRYADFSGRSRRKEYWMFMLFSVIVTMVCVTLLVAGGMSIDENGESTPGPLFWVGVVAMTVWGLGSIIPSMPCRFAGSTIRTSPAGWSFWVSSLTSAG